MKSLKIVSVAFWWLLASLPKISSASGIGSQGWQSDSGFSGTSDPIGGFFLLVVLIGLLLFGWTKGKSSIKWIYGPAFVGGLILYLIIGKTTVKALLGYPVVGILVGWMLMFIYSLFDQGGGKILPPKADTENDQKITKKNLNVTSQPGKAIFDTAPKTVLISKHANIQPNTDKRIPQYRNQFCDPMNVSNINLMLNSIPEHPGFAVITGTYGLRNVVVYGPNVREAVNVFMKWVINKTNSDWDEYFSLGFSPAKFSLINSAAENSGYESQLAQNENARLGVNVRSRLFDGTTGNKDVPVTIDATRDGAKALHTLTTPVGVQSIYTPSLDERRPTADQLREIEKFVETHKRKTVEQLTQPNAPKQARTKSDKSTNLSAPKLGFVPPTQCGNPGCLLTIKDIENFGEDLVRFLEHEAHRVYWMINGIEIDTSYIESLLPGNFNAEEEEFGTDLVDLARRAMKQFLKDVKIGFNGPFEKLPRLDTAIADFGQNSVTMAEKVMSHEFAEELIASSQIARSARATITPKKSNFIGGTTCHSETTSHPQEYVNINNNESCFGYLASPFQCGSKVTHRKNGEWGVGVITKMNGQYTTVSFPDHGKRFEILTDTIDEYFSITP